MNGEDPLISLVTPSYNQGGFIREAIESVLAQDYSSVEHIVIDGGSTDATLRILSEYTHLRVISERDRGHADAINKGFRLAKGAILGFLNSDDRLLPGALRRVSTEVDPEHGRHVVMGRCRFVDEQGRFTGIEHPSHFESHTRVLEVWKGHMIPQPAVFWSREAWQRCGPMRADCVSAWIDYDLFCRISKVYRFWFVDQVIADYRLHPGSKTVSMTESECLEECIAISRKYWGSRWTPGHWHLALSLAAFRFDRLGRGRAWLRKAQEARRMHNVLGALLFGVAGTALAPEVTFYVGLYPRLRDRVIPALAGSVWYSRHGRRMEIDPRVAAFMEYADVWPDGWVGPKLALSLSLPTDAKRLKIEGWTDLGYVGRRLVLVASVDGRVIGATRIAKTGEFSLEFPLGEPLSAPMHIVEVRASHWFVPDQYTHNADCRPLVWKLRAIGSD